MEESELPNLVFDLGALLPVSRCAPTLPAVPAWVPELPPDPERDEEGSTVFECEPPLEELPELPLELPELDE